MEATESISKGCFVFKNGTLHKKPKSKILNAHDYLKEQFWYRRYKNLWETTYEQIKTLRHSSYMNILQGLIEFMKHAHQYNCEVPLPAAILITGINQPDHAGQFNSVAQELKQQVTPHVALLFARSCPTIKNAIENMVMQFITDPDEAKTNKPIRKYQCNLLVLKSWYESHYSQNNAMSPSKKQKTKPTKKPLIVVLPDFESFNAAILQDFVLLLSNYTKSVPFILLFGVATSLSAVHKALPHHVTSKMAFQIFRSQPSLDMLHQILHKIILNPQCPFHLAGPALKLLTDVFLFYDFSVEGFINSFKFCMMHHYSNMTPAILCCDYQDIDYSIDQLSADDIEMIRRLPSFRPYVESLECQQRIDVLLKDEYLIQVLPTLIKNIHEYLKLFHVHLKILHELINKLPKTQLGKQLHELYIKAIMSHITEENDFKEYMHLLTFMSRHEFLDRLVDIIDLIKSEKNTETYESNVLCDMMKTLSAYRRELESDDVSSPIQHTENVTEDFSFSNISRNEMREILLQKSKQKKPVNKHETIKRSVIEYLQSSFKKYLYPPTATSLPLYELFVFLDLDSVRGHIIGSPRAALHTALNNPNYYLQCPCCVTDTKDGMVPSMPDICIAYKLHLECGKMINLYDWLQAFRTVLNANNSNTHNDEENTHEDEVTEIEPEIHARFTSCVAELQHLGFIKSSNRKADHVTRLTW